MISNKKTIAFFGLILALFIGLHLFGLHLPYHQDEYKWVQYSHPEITPPGTVPHPPLTEFIYTRIGPVVGDSNFRSIPFVFGIINIFLLYYLVNYLYNRKTALISILLFTLSFYSLLATLMVDVDGAVMPFFFLLLLIGYFRWKNSNFTFDSKNYKWIFLILVGGIGGFFIKVSSILPIIAVFIDFLFEIKAFSDRKKIAKYATIGFVGVLLLVGLLIVSKFIFPFFNLQYALKYWEHFVTSNRGWFQTFIQCVKAVLYTSPFLIFIPLFLKKIDIVKLRAFILFLISAFIFYIVLFDFSIGALDRYLQLLVLPLIIFSSVVLAEVFELQDNRSKEFLLGGIVLSLFVLMLASVNHFVPPLYPKTEWIYRILSLRWNFLYPFSGGSGPLGFYMSFLVMVIVWIISLCAVAYALYKKDQKKRIIIFLIPLGILYNGLFIEEYLFGFYNGSAPKLVQDATAFIKNDDDIKMVTVYNDNGGWNIQTIGKYRRRLYIDPKFDINEKVENINKYKEHYLVVDVPHIDSNTVYAKYFSSCKDIWNEKSGYIKATVYDCRNAPELKVE